MKKFIPAATAAILSATIIGFKAAPVGIAQEAAARDDVKKFVAIAQIMADSRNNPDDAVSAATNAVAFAAPGQPSEGFLGEIIVSQMAAVEQWDGAMRNKIMKALATQSAKIGGSDAAATASLVRQAFAAMFMVSKDSGALYAAIDATPANLRDTAKDAVQNAQAILGARKALKYKSLYATILNALGAKSTGDFITDPTRVTITTTTTTSTSTTTTTTGFRLDGRPSGGGRPSYPATPPGTPSKPTPTRPSPTPVGQQGN